MCQELTIAGCARPGCELTWATWVLGQDTQRGLERSSCTPARENRVSVYVELRGFEPPLAGMSKEMRSPRLEKEKWDQNQDSTRSSGLETAFLVSVYVTFFFNVTQMVDDEINLS